MLDRLSTRQKTKALLSMLDVPTDGKEYLDSMIKEYVGSPIVGAIIGEDITNVESLIEYGIRMSAESNPESLSSFGALIQAPKVREALARGFAKLVLSQPKQIQEMVINAMSNISEMDVEEFNKDFTDIEDFVGNGLLLYVANSSSLGNSDEDDLVICPDCGHIFGES